MTFPTSPAPHVVAPNSVQRVMLLVLATLAPAVVMHVVFFGIGLLVQLLLGVLVALASEALALTLRRKPLQPSLTDASAIITGVLIAMCLPPLAPWWMVVSGSAFAILLAKHLYGGLGSNPFNPAMVGYAVLLVSFPVQLTHWLPPQFADLKLMHPGIGDSLYTIFVGHLPPHLSWDGMTSPTALASMRNSLSMGMTMQEAQSNPMFGQFGERGWDWINLSLLVGGVWLLVLRIIRWHIPVAMLLAIAIPAAVMSAVDPGAYPGAVFHLTSGASMLGAFYIATDPVSAATSNRGKLIYGAGIGLITYIIRTWGGYPDGVAFAVLLMNAAVPLIDRYTVPRIYGHARE